MADNRAICWPILVAHILVYLTTNPRIFMWIFVETAFYFDFAHQQTRGTLDLDGNAPQFKSAERVHKLKKIQAEGQVPQGDFSLI